MRDPFPPLAVIASVLVLIALTGFEARGQQENEGFRYAQPKAKPSPNSVPVVRSEEVRVVKIWELNQTVPGAQFHRHMIPTVEKVSLSSNGKIRLYIAIKNTAENVDWLQFNFKRCYLADAEAEIYPALDRDIDAAPDGSAHVDIPGSTKIRFWLEFDAPKKPTRAFKFLIATDGTSDGRMAHNEFPLFIVKLTEPVSAKLAAEATGPEGPARAEGPDLALAMHALIKEAKRFEGNSVTAKGTKEAIRVDFQPDPEDEEGVVAHLAPIRTPISQITISGWIMPEATTPSGLIIKMKGPSLTYRFSFDGKVLTGTDNKKGKYTLLPVGKDPG